MPYCMRFFTVIILKLKLKSIIFWLVKEEDVIIVREISTVKPIIIAANAQLSICRYGSVVNTAEKSMFAIHVTILIIEIKILFLIFYIRLSFMYNITIYKH